MTVVLWVFLGLAGVGWAGLGLLLVCVWMRPPGRPREMGMWVVSVWFALVAIPLSLPGGVAGVWLAARLDALIMGIAGGILLAVVAVAVVGLWWERRRLRAWEEEPPRLPTR